MSSKNNLTRSAPLSQQALDGIAFSSLATVVQGVGQLVVLALLARYVSKVEFGLVTTTLIVIGLGRIMGETLVRPALVQREQLSTQDIATASALSLLFGIGFTSGLWWLASPIGALLSEPDITPIVRTLAFVMVLQAPGNVAEGLIQRELGFKGMAAAEVLSFTLGYAAVGVTLALAHAGVWALVYAYLAQVTLKTLFLVWRQPDSLRLAFHPGSARKTLWLSGGFISARLFNYGATQGDYAVVAGAMGSEAVGIYGRAYHLLSMLATLVGQSLDRVMFPIYARLQDDLVQAAHHYRRVVALSATIMLPVSVLLIVLAPEIVRLILGPDWPETVTPLRILAASLLFRTGYKLNDPLTKGLGLVYNRAWRLALYAACVVLGALFGLRWGLAGVSAGVSSAIVLNFFLMAQLSIQRLNITWSEFLGLHMRGVVLAALMLPLAMIATNFLRAYDVVYWGVLFSVLSFIGLSWVIAVVLRPDLTIGPELFWIARVVGSRFNPDNAAASRAAQTSHDSPKIDRPILVEIYGLCGEGGQTLVNRVVEQLKLQDVPAINVMLHTQHQPAWPRRLQNNLRVAISAFRRAPRATLFQCLTLLGIEEQQNNAFGRMFSFLVDSEQLTLSRTKPGMHIFTNGPLPEIRSIDQDKTYKLTPSSLQGLFQLNHPDFFINIQTSITIAAQDNPMAPSSVDSCLQKLYVSGPSVATNSDQQSIEQWVNSVDSTGKLTEFINLKLTAYSPQDCANQIARLLAFRWNSRSTRNRKK
ncbi:MAG: lipopolysaccharide biosynthesis protein [Pseudomonadales bacterium]